MSDLRLRARSVTEIVDAAFQLYRRDTLEYVLVTAVAYAPWVLVQLLLLRGITTSGAQRLGVPAPTTFGLMLLGVFAYTLMSAVLSRFSSDVYLDRPTGLTDVILAVLPLIPRIIGATFLLGLVLMLGFIPMIVGGVSGSLPLVFLGMLLSIAWVLYALARFFAVFPTIVLEQQSAVGAFSRSSVLSRGRKGHVLGTLLLVIGIFIALTIALAMLGAVLGNAGSVVLQSLYTVIAYPLIGITQMVLYYDTRIRAEGFDIEVMTGALGTPAPTTAP